MLTDYRLPNGRIVAIAEDVARGERLVSFEMKGTREIVMAERLTPDHQRLYRAVREHLDAHTVEAQRVNFKRCGCECCVRLRVALGEQQQEQTT